MAVMFTIRRTVVLAVSICTCLANSFVYAPNKQIGIVQADTSASSVIYFSTQNTERMRIDSSGNVGIGTITPLSVGGKTLHVENSTVGAILWSDGTRTGELLASASAGVTVGSRSNHSLQFVTNDTERMRIDTSGNVGIGVTPNASVKLQVKTATNQDLAVVSSSFVAGGVGLAAVNDAYNAYTALDIQGSSIQFGTGGTERMRILAGGNVGIGETNPTGALVVSRTAAAAATNTLAFALSRPGTADSLFSYWSDAYGPNAASATLKLGSISATGRSINSTGTNNASGSDYAEYMTKCGDFVVAKGDVVGVNAEGKLTNVFADAVAFLVKSTNPSFVGGDSWGSDFEDNLEELEVARQAVDRIAFSGQVPVNVTGATAGQYIIPVNNNGAIKGQAVSNPTFEQYQIAVGKVIAIEADGRAKIIVKVA